MTIKALGIGAVNNFTSKKRFCSSIIYKNLDAVKNNFVRPLK